MSRVAVLGGRAVARAPGVAALRRPRARRARAAGPRRRSRSTSAPDLVERLRDARPDVAFVALHGRDGEDGTVQEILELVGVPYTASGPSACMRCMDKVLAKHALRDAGLPTPDFYAFSQTAFESLGAAHALPAIEERLDFPVVVKPAAQGSALGIRFAPTAADVPGAIIAAFSYDTKVLLERHVTGRELAVSVLDGPDGARGAAGRRGDPARRRPLRLRGALRDRPHATSSARRSSTPRTTARAQALALDAYRVLGCYGFARVDLMLDEQTASDRPRGNAIPGLTETSLLPQAAEAAGIPSRVRRAGRSTSRSRGDGAPERP